MSSPMTVTVEEDNVTVLAVAAQGPQGLTGPAGAAGPGVAAGGSAGQFLTKNSATDYETGWSSTLAVANGGTGAANAQAAQAALKGAYVLATSAVASSVTGTTTETTLASVTIPANAMGANGILRVTTGWSHTSSANAKTLRVKFGGTNYGSTNITTNNTTRDQRQIANRNATDSQVGMSSTLGGFGSSGNSITTSSHDTTTDVTLAFTGQLANSGETITLEYYLVELMVP